jgi:predicted nuclease of restriction endonuclease-like (RecB) superfamily
MIRFSEVIPDIRIVQSLIAQLTWTHILQLIYIDDPLRRDFYIEMCKHENWSTRMLKKKIEDAILHEMETLFLNLEVIGNKVTRVSTSQTIAKKFHRKKSCKNSSEKQ